MSPRSRSATRCSAGPTTAPARPSTWPPTSVSWAPATGVGGGAAGGVGSITVQLARHVGATVIGLASESNHEWLRGHGVIPVSYGDGVEDRIRAAAPGGVDAFIDTVGGDYVQLALDLGVAPDRVDTIANF